MAGILPLASGAEWKCRDRVLGEGEKDSFIALSGKGGATTGLCLKAPLLPPPPPPLWERLGGAFIVWEWKNRVIGKGQSRRELALFFQSWCWGGPKIGSEDPSFGMNNASSTSSICWGFQFCGRSQSYYYAYSLRRKKDLASRLHCCLLTIPPGLCIPSLPWLATFWTCFFEIQGMLQRPKLIPPRKEMGDTEKLVCPGTPQGPAWFLYQPVFACSYHCGYSFSLHIKLLANPVLKSGCMYTWTCIHGPLAQQLEWLHIKVHLDKGLIQAFVPVCVSLILSFSCVFLSYIVIFFILFLVLYW